MSKEKFLGFIYLFLKKKKLFDWAKLIRFSHPSSESLNHHQIFIAVKYIPTFSFPSTGWQVLSLLSAEEHLFLWMPSKEQKVSEEVVGMNNEYFLLLFYHIVVIFPASKFAYLYTMH